MTETPSKTPLASLVTFPAWWRRISPVVNISEWIPNPPSELVASSVATMFGMAPMPVCSVEPSLT